MTSSKIRCFLTLQFSDICINCSIGFLEDNPSVEGEGKAEGQRTWGGWSYLKVLYLKVQWFSFYSWWLHCVMWLCPATLALQMATGTELFLVWMLIRVGMLKFVNKSL